MSDELMVGSDGLPTRVVGAWAEEKLFYIQRYIDIFSTGMKKHWPRRLYLDLFSGPGRCRVEGSAVEFAGSPLRALDPLSRFTQLYFNDSDPAVVAALRQRTVATGATNVIIRQLDCNAAAREAPEVLDLDRENTIALAVIDPTAFQISFDALETLTRGRRVDIIVTLMTGYLKRFIAEPGFQPRLDEFFGTQDWRTLVNLRAQGGHVTFRKLLDHYEARLKSIGYANVDDDVRVLNSRHATLYHLVFASKHKRGQDFFRKISLTKFSGQRRLL